MDQKHKKVIQNNFSSLVEQTDLDLMVTTLYEKGVFSERMIEPYKDTAKDVRTHKRALYTDIQRRGPKAFQNLLDSLSELGYWDLARSLDPDSHLHPRQQNDRNTELLFGNDNFVSISNEKRKIATNAPKPVPEALLPDPITEPFSEIPQFNVIKSTKFYEDNDKEPTAYRTRGKQRGMLLVFNYTSYSYDLDRERKGADVDCDNLKYLFSDIGFKAIVSTNLSRKETLDKCKSLQMEDSLVGYECLFVVVSSHGYEKHNSSDTDFRCRDGQLIPCRELIRQFNNINLPKLKGIPKVFIFQICRGSVDDLVSGEGDVVVDAGLAGAPAGGGGTGSGGGGAGDERWPAPPAHDRAYSDILIAHSTLPGYVSHRDPVRGSWYVQALCEVVAARAHDRHVAELLALADDELRRRYPAQTSSVDSWGFNRKLYLHPGLYED